MFLGLDSAAACAQGSVPIAYPAESPAENHPGLGSGGDVGMGGSGCASRPAAGCLPAARHPALGKLSQAYL